MAASSSQVVGSGVDPISAVFAKHRKQRIHNAGDESTLGIPKMDSKAGDIGDRTGSSSEGYKEVWRILQEIGNEPNGGANERMDKPRVEMDSFFQRPKNDPNAYKIRKLPLTLAETRSKACFDKEYTDRLREIQDEMSKIVQKSKLKKSKEYEDSCMNEMLKFEELVHRIVMLNSYRGRFYQYNGGKMSYDLLSNQTLFQLAKNPPGSIEDVHFILYKFQEHPFSKRIKNPLIGYSESLNYWKLLKINASRIHMLMTGQVTVGGLRQMPCVRCKRGYCVSYSGCEWEKASNARAQANDIEDNKSPEKEPKDKENI